MECRNSYDGRSTKGGEQGVRFFSLFYLHSPVFGVGFSFCFSFRRAVMNDVFRDLALCFYRVVERVPYFFLFEKKGGFGDGAGGCIGIPFFYDDGGFASHTLWSVVCQNAAWDSRQTPFLFHLSSVSSSSFFFFFLWKKERKTCEKKNICNTKFARILCYYYFFCPHFFSFLFFSSKGTKKKKKNPGGKKKSRAFLRVIFFPFAPLSGGNRDHHACRRVKFE